MRYLGNKTSLSKELAPVLMEKLNGNNYYIETMVGACGMIQAIDYPKRFASDYNPYIVALMSNLNNIEIYPEKSLFDGFAINEELYREVKANQDAYSKHLVGLLAFGCSFGGKFWGGYARGGLTSKGLERGYAQETLRNLVKLAPKLKNVKFANKSYLDVHIPSKSIVYLDPPYQGTTKYSNNFDHKGFWEYVRYISKTNFVYISEYNAPEDFDCIFQKECKVGIDHKLKEHNKSIEKLFVYKEGLK